MSQYLATSIIKSLPISIQYSILCGPVELVPKDMHILQIGNPKCHCTGIMCISPIKLITF